MLRSKSWLDLIVFDAPGGAKGINNAPPEDSVWCHLLSCVPGDVSHLHLFFSRLSPDLNSWSHLPALCAADSTSIQGQLHRISGSFLQRVVYPRPFPSCYLSWYVLLSCSKVLCYYFSGQWILRIFLSLLTKHCRLFDRASVAFHISDPYSQALPNLLCTSSSPPVIVMALPRYVNRSTWFYPTACY